MPALHHLVATLLVERQAGEAGADHHPLVSGRGDDRLGAAEQGAAHAEARPVGIDVEAAQLLALHRAEADRPGQAGYRHLERSEEHTSELQSLMRISYAVFCLKKKTAPTPRDI